MEILINRSSIFAGLSLRLASYFLNPQPQTRTQSYIKFLLAHFHYLRRKIMSIAENSSDWDIYNIQAIEILEKAGFTEPTEQQIATIERLLKAK